MKKLFYTLLFLMTIATVNAQIPALQVQDTTGTNVMLEDVMDADKNYLVLFWASWCGICRNELAHWKSYTNSWMTNHNVKIILVSTDSPSQHENAKNLYLSNEWDGDLYYASSSAVNNAYGFVGVPRYFLYDTDRNKIKEHSGFSSGDEMELNNFIVANFTTTNVQDLSSETYLINQDNDFIYLQSSTDWSNASFRLYDLSGKLIQQVEKQATAQTVQFNKAELLKGHIYLVNWMENRQPRTQKVFVW